MPQHEFDIITASRHKAPYPDYKTRYRHLNALITMLKDPTNQTDLIDALRRDYGGHRSEHMTRIYEILPSLEQARHAIEHLKNYVKPKSIRPSMWFQPSSATVTLRPKGVVGIMVPWNYPIFLALGPLIAALQAGNHVLLKLSEDAPETGLVLQRLLKKAFPDGTVDVVLGGVDASITFSKLPFDHLFFTGSPAVGKHIMTSAAANHTSVTLELGGKSPAVISRSADLNKAMDAVLRGKLVNGGQTCVAPDYLVLPEECVEDTVDIAKVVVMRRYPNLMNKNPYYTAIINERHVKRLEGMLADAIDKGAKVIPLGTPASGELENDRRFQPSLILNVTDDMKLMQEEIFGPLLPVKTYQHFEEVPAMINQPATKQPLALYYFGKPGSAEQTTLLERVPAGGVTINDCLYHVGVADLPFGGVGRSGTGRYHGDDNPFADKQAALTLRTHSLLNTTHPPYDQWTSFAEWMITNVNLHHVKRAISLLCVAGVLVLSGYVATHIKAVASMVSGWF